MKSKDKFLLSKLLERISYRNQKGMQGSIGHHWFFWRKQILTFEEILYLSAAGKHFSVFFLYTLLTVFSLWHHALWNMFLSSTETQCTNYNEKKCFVGNYCLKSKCTQGKIFKFNIVIKKEYSIKDNQKTNFDIKHEERPSNLKRGKHLKNLADEKIRQ